MINFVRKVVAGPKNRTVWEQYDLDLTYITDRIIAMAFPASGVEKTYRNSIDQVSEYLGKKHNENYLIINVSMRKYDYSKFGNRVKEYNWLDHQAPTLPTLFKICTDMYNFLSVNKQNVVVVHCNHGKGRTGSAIIAFLIFLGYKNTLEDTLNFYNKRRFSEETYGVDQPCQKRVLEFFQTIVNANHINSRLIALQLKQIHAQGINVNDYYVKISSTRNEYVFYKAAYFGKQKDLPEPLMGDIFIEVYQKKWNGDTQIARINYHTEFIYTSETQAQFQINFKGEDIKVKNHHKKFILSFIFQLYCVCHKIPIEEQQVQSCKCANLRSQEEPIWNNIKKAIEMRKDIDKNKASQLLFNIQQQKQYKQQKDYNE